MADVRDLVAAARSRLGVTQPPAVAVGYVHDDADRSTSFEESMVALREFDSANARLLRRRIPVRFATDGLPAARNELVSQFLRSECDWLLMVDCDMGFAPDALYRLLEAADPVARPIVGGLCFTSRDVGPDGMHGHRTRPVPTIYDWTEDPQLRIPGPIPVLTYPVNALLRCSATGAAFLLLHRSALQRIAEFVPRGADRPVGEHWFDRTHDAAGHLLGEDLSFCVRANLADVPVHVHTGVRTSHYKPAWLSEADHWASFTPPPAMDEVAVVVPVLRRPHNAAPFMRSLRASTGLARVYAVADDDDPATAQAWRDAGAEVIVAEPVDGQPLRTFAKKVNLGYRKTSEPWLFMVGDDVTFRPGWLDHAQHVAAVFNASVVGTNDLGNPRVTSGEHATHMLIRRSYVDAVGASFDGPGVVAHEGYRHWGVDDELVAAAKRRGVWQMALGSVVEHNHPYWGKAADDEVYRLGQSHAERDLALLQRRLAENGVTR